ncbi:unnamed protein product [Heterobilharzia americana]|nr:unnamed protein product [Heterobilharzia americana]
MRWSERVYACLNGRREILATKPLRVLLDNENTKAMSIEKLSRQSLEQKTITHPEEAWCHLQSAVKAALKTMNDAKRAAKKSHCISASSSELTDAGEHILAGSEYNEE